jgi:hypothetical protein
VGACTTQVEDEVKPPPYQSRTPVIHRPFEDAQWFNAIGWPFKHWQASRFSDGTFGVWYGCDTVETSVYETAYHWFSGFLTDYGVAQSVGARLHREGHPGLVTASVRRATGEIYAVLNPNVLSNPRQHSQLSYRLDARHIVIEKKPGVAWMKIDTAGLWS